MEGFVHRVVIGVRGDARGDDGAGVLGTVVDSRDFEHHGVGTDREPSRLLALVPCGQQVAGCLDDEDDVERAGA